MTIRVAASRTIGAGHAARCTAVAAELRKIGASVRWACDSDTLSFLLERGESQGEISLLSAAVTSGRHCDREAAAAEQERDALTTLTLGPTDWVLIDSYALGVAWQRVFRANGIRIAVFDDLLDRPLVADIVINAAAACGDYSQLAPGAHELCGLRWGIVGDPSRPPASPPGCVLVSFGASDPENLTCATLRALAGTREFTAVGAPPTVVLLGAAASSLPAVEALIAEMPWASLAPTGLRSPGNALLAIGAAGVGLLERMHAGIPCVSVVAAGNQRGLADAAVRVGAAITAETPEAAVAAAARLIGAPQRLAEMSEASRNSVDGCGAKRVASAMNRLCDITLRQATMEDAATLHRWRNHASARAASHSTTEIPWNQHVGWLMSTLARHDSHVLVAERRGRPLGTIRFDVDGDCATVSIAVDPELQGAGVGRAILAAGGVWLDANDPRVCRCRAEIRPENEPSIKAFLAAGYIAGVGAYELQLRRRCGA